MTGAAEHLAWPWFDDDHRALAAEVDAWACDALGGGSAHEGDVDVECRRLVRLMGDAGWLRHVVPREHGGARDALDVRTLCLLRETIGRHDGLAEFALAMQGLGAGPVSLFGTDAQRREWLPRVAAGEAIAALAISEAQAGSDVAAMRTIARREDDGWVLNGEKSWISNAGIADFYSVFARLEGEEQRAYVALLVPADTPGLSVPERVPLTAPHPLGTVRFDDVRLPASALIGLPGRGLRVAFGTLDVFRTTVGAAALGFARRALGEATAWVRERIAFGKPLAEQQLVQAKLAEMATAVDASALLVYRAAWTRDMGAERVTREAAMAKMYATEAAQRVVDDAVQLFGGRGVVRGAVVERLYREVRALRIYEGATDILKIVIAGQHLASAAEAERAAGVAP